MPSPFQAVTTTPHLSLTERPDSHPLRSTCQPRPGTSCERIEVLVEGQAWLENCS